MVASFLISTFGFGFFLYGKKQVRVPHLVVGIAMMAYPYVVTGTAAILGIAAALVLALWVAVRVGL
jgi:hypothetical protein